MLSQEDLDKLNEQTALAIGWVKSPGGFWWVKPEGDTTGRHLIHRPMEGEKVFSPATDWADAGIVFKAMSEQGLFPQLNQQLAYISDRKKWRCQFGSYRWAIAEIPEQAICFAATSVMFQREGTNRFFNQC